MRGRFADDPRRTTWTRVRCIEALHAWVAEHGDLPTCEDWARATPTSPAANMIRPKFGSWNAFIAAAGYTPRPSGAQTKWTRARIVTALHDWLFEHGRWPTKRDWPRATDKHPNGSAVKVTFGSWNAARRAAGYTGSPRRKFNGRGRHIRPKLILEAIGCVSCGTELENQTVGCSSCNERHSRRERRTRKAETAASTFPGTATVSDTEGVAHAA